MSIKSPVNFLQLGRYGKYGEQRYRQQFEGSFDSYNFNAALLHQYCGLDVISRFRDDVRLRYILQVQKTRKRGRPKTIGQTVDFANMDMKHFRIEKENEDIRISTCHLQLLI